MRVAFLILLFALCFALRLMSAMGPVWGPVMGSIGPHQIRITYKTKSPDIDQVLFLKDAYGARQVYNSSKSEVHTSSGTIHHFRLSGLKADSYYNFVIKSSNDSIAGSFRTFPEDSSHGNFSFTFGSCNENYQDQSIFSTMQKQHPLFFLHLGDWTYPDHEPYPAKSNGKNRLYTANYTEALKAYDIRCTLPVMKDFLQTTPIDFVYDDDDMTIDGCSRTTYTELNMKGKICEMIEHPMPDSVRMNCINAYFASFPAYEMVHDKTEGAYHSYRCGNTEIFFLDTRADRSPDTEIFHSRKNGKWRFRVQRTHNNLGDQQYQWLLNSLKSSTAVWKIIASGTNFNVGYKKVLDLSMVLQSYVLPNGMNGAFVAAMLSSEWCGYPYQQRGLLNFCNQHKISNVVFISGDAHTAAIDDGANSGFPECLSGNLAVDNSKQLDYIHNKLNFNIWNQGGQGINNNNYENTLGKIEVFGSDSLRMNVIDSKGLTLVQYTLKPGFIPRHYAFGPGVKMTATGKLSSVGHILGILKKRKQMKKNGEI